MKKYILDLTVKSVEAIGGRYALLRLTDDKPLPEMMPGQFVEVRVDGSPGTFLRRPISINQVSVPDNELWLLVAAVGDGTRWIAASQPGDRLNCVLPLGRGFTLPEQPGGHYLLVGGGVGVAPLLYLGHRMCEMGVEPTFLLGARVSWYYWSRVGSGCSGSGGVDASDCNCGSASPVFSRTPVSIAISTKPSISLTSVSFLYCSIGTPKVLAISSE